LPWEAQHLLSSQLSAEEEVGEQGRGEKLRLDEDGEDWRVEPAQRDELEHLLAVVYASWHEHSKEGAPFGAQEARDTAQCPTVAQDPDNREERLEGLCGQHGRRVEKFGLAADGVSEHERL